MGLLLCLLFSLPTPEPAAAFDAASPQSPLLTESSSQLTQKAQVAMAAGDAAAAAAAASAAISADPQDFQAYGVRALAFIRQADWDRALSDLNSALALSPREKTLLYTRAYVLNRLRRFEEAKSSARLALDADRDLAEAWFELSEAENGLGRSEAGLMALGEAARLNPRDFAPRHKQALRSRSRSAPVPEVPASAAAPSSSGAPSGARIILLTLLSSLIGGSLLAAGLFPGRIEDWLKSRGEGPAGEDAEAAGETGGPAPSGYRIVRQIGTGGMGTVFEAVDLSLDRRVAVKRMREKSRLESRDRERFIQEAKTVARLRHPNIIEIYAVLDDGRELFLVFEFVDGFTLDAILARCCRIPFDRCLDILRQACAALSYAHGQGIVHRDIKPSNVMLTREKEVKIMDFGIARQKRLAAGPVSMTRSVAGTPPYMAPEAESGEVRKESDLYSLAVCFYEMLTGELPFQGTGAGLLLNKMRMNFIPASRRSPHLPAGLDAFFEKALNPDPGRRPASAEEFFSAVSAMRS